MSEQEPGLDSASTQSEKIFFIVGIGASAGGLRALEEFFEHLPTDSGAAFVVVQHLSPDFKSLMKELLGRCTRMAIYRVTEGMELEPNSVYLIPPGKNLILQGRKLRLLEQSARNTQKLNFPIDLFLESLAEQHRNCSIGVILSGTGSDGTKGLKAINAEGGYALVQHPETAEFDGMPRSAIATKIVDRILPTPELAQTICQLVQSPDLLSNSSKESRIELLEANLQEIAQILAQQGETDFSDYKPSTLSRRIDRRYLISGCSSMREYIELLKTSPTERAVLHQDLLISVTHFFRDPPAWNFLKNKVIPDLIANTEADEELRCWVTACATGEEAYSLAILLEEAIAFSPKPVRFKIFATDIDRSALEKAARGIYSQTIARDISPELIEKYFVYKDNSLQIIRRLREKLLFAPHDFTKDAGFARMNLISCRNVLIYLQSELQSRVLRNLHFSLASKGILFLGDAENLGKLQAEFNPIDRQTKIYQKRRDVRLNLQHERLKPVPRLPKIRPNTAV